MALIPSTWALSECTSHNVVVDLLRLTDGLKSWFLR